MVTGSSYATAQNGYDEVDTPTLVGYTADKSSVAQVLFGNEPTSDLADSTVVVTYTANPVAPDNGGNGGNDSDGGTPTQRGLIHRLRVTIRRLTTMVTPFQAMTMARVAILVTQLPAVLVMAIPLLMVKLMKILQWQQQLKVIPQLVSKKLLTGHCLEH